MTADNRLGTIKIMCFKGMTMSINYEELTHPGIQALVPYQPGKSIIELEQEQGLTDIIKMASNENPLGCSPRVLEALRSSSAHLLATYPSAINHPLMAKLAKKLGLSTEQLFLSNGSDFIYSLLLNCFALHSDKHILTHEYAFSTYAIQAKTLNIEVRTVVVDSDWQVNVARMAEACTNETSLVFIANPNNPTGLLLSQEKIKYLLEHIPKDTLLVLDEAYYEFAAAQQQGLSTDWLCKHPNLIITRTFSKIYGMAGFRLGYALANPEIISLLRRVQLPFTVNQLALSAGYVALDDEDFIALSLETNKQGMAQLIKGFEHLDIDYLESACNFLTFDCKEDSLSLYNYLLNNGIIVRPLHAYKLPNHLRVSVGTTEQNHRFLEALANYYN